MDELPRGDILAGLRGICAKDSVDPSCLDPPSKSNAGYDAPFRTPDGEESPAQIEALDAAWTWNVRATDACQGVRRSGNAAAMTMAQVMRSSLGGMDMPACPSMMAVRMAARSRTLSTD